MGSGEDWPLGTRNRDGGSEKPEKENGLHASQGHTAQTIITSYQVPPEFIGESARVGLGYANIDWPVAREAGQYSVDLRAFSTSPMYTGQSRLYPILWWLNPASNCTSRFFLVTWKGLHIRLEEQGPMTTGRWPPEKSPKVGDTHNQINLCPSNLGTAKIETKHAQKRRWSGAVDFSCRGTGPAA